MKFLVWVAEHAIMISSIGAAVAVALKFERWLPSRLTRILLTIDIFIIVATPMLGLLKDHLDAKWKAELKQQADATEAVTMRLEAKQRPRVITLEQRVKFTELLNSSPRGFVRVVATASNTETDNYSSQIRKMLDEAGYGTADNSAILHSVGAVQESSSFANISLGVYSTNDVPSYAVHIQNAFREIGIDIPIMTCKGADKILMKPGDLFVIVAENR